MLNTIKKEMTVVTVLFIVVIGIMFYNITSDFVFYDFVYMIVLSEFYVRYIKLKKKQKEYIDEWYVFFVWNEVILW